jgi:hypothetical protein
MIFWRRLMMSRKTIFNALLGLSLSLACIPVFASDVDDSTDLHAQMQAEAEALKSPFARCTFRPLPTDRGMTCSAFMTMCPPAPTPTTPGAIAPEACNANMSVSCGGRPIYQGKYDVSTVGARTVYSGQSGGAFSNPPSIITQQSGTIPGTYGAVLTYKLKNRTGSCLIPGGQQPAPAPAPAPGGGSAPAPAPAPAPTH